MDIISAIISTQNINITFQVVKRRCTLFVEVSFNKKIIVTSR